MKDKKVKRIVLIIGILILLILLGVFVFGLFKRSIINKPYVYFGYRDTAVPAAVGYEPGYEYCYINYKGYIVKDEREAGKNTKRNVRLIGKLSEEEISQLEGYIISEVERINNENNLNQDSMSIDGLLSNLNTDTNCIVSIENKIECNDRNLVSNLLEKFN